MFNVKQPIRFQWQNPILLDSIYPFRRKKLVEFLLFYKESEYLKEMRKATPEIRLSILREVAKKADARREEFERDFREAFNDLVANDKWFALKKSEKTQLWYLQDQVKFTKRDNWKLVDRLLKLFEQKNKLPQRLDLNTDPKPEELTRFKMLEEEERLNKLSLDELLKLILDKFDAEPDTFPQWLQYMTVHFSGMRYKSAHGSWANPDVLLQILQRDKPEVLQGVLLPAPAGRGQMPIPADLSSLATLKSIKNRFPGWMWKEIVRYTELRTTEVTKDSSDWESTSLERYSTRENRAWNAILTEWLTKDITQWRIRHRETIDLIVSRSVCNEISEDILHLRWLTPSGGLNFKVDWYRHRAKETENLPTNHPRKVIFKRATSVADFKPGASIFWLVWYPHPPNSANVAYEIPGFNFFPDGVSLNGGSKKKRPKGKGGQMDAEGWKYAYAGNRLIRTRKLNEQEIQVQLNAKKRELELERVREINLFNQMQAQQKLKLKNLTDDKKKKQLKKKEEKMGAGKIKNAIQFAKQLDKELALLRRSLAGQQIQQTLRWRHEAIVVSVEDMATGPYVWTFETETEIGLNRRYLYDLLGTDNNDDYQVFIGYMPSLDNLPSQMEPEKFLSRTFMPREQASQLKDRLREMLRRDWILPGRYPEPTYPTPPTKKPVTELPSVGDTVTNLPPAEKPRWVQVIPPNNGKFITNAFYKVRNKKNYPIMIPTPKEKRQRLAAGTLVGVSRTHKESPDDAGDGTVKADGPNNFFYLITVCKDFPDAEGTFIRTAHTADVADPAAFRKAQEKEKPPTKSPDQPDVLVESTVDPEDELKPIINCWERKLGKTKSGLPAFKLPTEVPNRIQLQRGWKLTVKEFIAAENGYFHEIVKCDMQRKAVGWFVRTQDIALPEPTEEPLPVI